MIEIGLWRFEFGPGNWNFGIWHRGFGLGNGIRDWLLN